jgi:hypothetical protein
VLLALVFSMLGQPSLSLGEHLLSVPHMMTRSGWSAVSSTWAVIWGDLDFPVWTASTVGFLLTYGFGLALINGIAL